MEVTLTGSPEQVAWAETVRTEKLAELDEYLAESTPANEAAAARIEWAAAKMRGAAGAGWWIDQRNRPVTMILRRILALEPGAPAR